LIEELEVREHPGGATFEVWLQPRSSHRKVVGIHGGALKIKITSPPLEGRANKECLQFLASILFVPASSLRILSGENSRRKRIFVPLPPDRVREIIEELVG